MLRAGLIALLLTSACRHDIDGGPEHPRPDQLAPLPPASGTPIGYLLDDRSTLKLSDEQVTKLQELDASLAAQQADIDTQLRQIEKPTEEEPQEKGAPRKPRNMAPGKNIVTTPEGDKLHQIRKQNDHEALIKAYAVLDKNQQDEATKILQDHGVEPPSAKKAPPKKPDAADGVPMEP